MADYCQATDFTIHSIVCEPITQSTSVSDGLEPGGKRIRFTPDTLSEKSQGTVTVCTGCGTSLDETSKHCGRCLWARYCSRYCQVADWKRHKLTCGNPNPENTYQEPTDNRASVTEHAKILAAVARRAAGQGKVEPALQTHVPKPLTQLKALKWLFNRSESDICKLIVDALRLRFWDDDDLNDMFVLRLMQTGIESIVKRDFFELSTKLARKARLLPKWWAQSNTDNLIRFGIADEPWEREGGGVERPHKMLDLLDRYGDPLIYLQLCMFAEQLFGVVPGRKSVLPQLEEEMKSEQ